MGAAQVAAFSVGDSTASDWAWQDKEVHSHSKTKNHTRKAHRVLKNHRNLCVRLYAYVLVTSIIDI